MHKGGCTPLSIPFKHYYISYIIMLAWIILIIINLFILRRIEPYIFVKDKDTGETFRLMPGPSGLVEV